MNGILQTVQITSERHKGFQDTGRQMHEMALLWYADADFARGWSPERFFQFVDEIPYMNDDTIVGTDAELIGRPLKCLRIFNALDCKKKATFVGQYAILHGIPYQFIAVGENGNPVGHVFARLYLQGDWCSFDATIPGLYKMGSPMPTVTEAWIL